MVATNILDETAHDALDHTGLTGVGGSGGAYSDWTPALTATTTNPTLGTGSSAGGRYAQDGDHVHGFAAINFGSSGVNAGNGTYTISLPVNMRVPVNGDGVIVGYGRVFDSSANAVRFVVLSYVSTSTVTMRTVHDGAVVVHNAPWAWAASDQIAFEFSYEAA